ncbi:saccharopine dehydrogenase NADP-binding domain-containing protein [Actinacidiphila epipremni]|uniref:NAD(P)H-binding protein n=1 Tax=Actinacidiphila epipremni TaxID=2053013 RepID=A0ABX0ZVW1_9ACTN|nr:saccharopine dehydrogenase NADP-binding domain-containing protein [Actinacidiphila epipremni]NJP48185.1 NAD(P)H-binding protein [Actinacidiphila epipremni]
MAAERTVAVFGAYGHTGRFVVAELARRGFTPVAGGRDAGRLREAAARAGAEARPASVDDPASLDRLLAGAAAVVNCAGPFAATAGPVAEAALRAGIAYVDVAAEIEANRDTFERFAGPAQAAGTIVLPAMAFFGGLGDLLATAAMGDWPGADQAHVAYGLSSWHPTPGTRAAGAVSHERRGGRRVRFSGGRLEHHDEPLPTLEWDFPAPAGRRTVLGDFTMADSVTVPHHLAVPDVRGYMTVEAARDLSSPDTPPPAAAGEDGRSAQTFVVDVVLRRGAERRRAGASGRDIYAVSAPLAVEAVTRVLDGRTAVPAGAASAGELFDAADFLRALAPYVTVELPD